MAGRLRLVLGDQLSDSLSALSDLDPAVDVVLMAESTAEATWAKHHKKKLTLVYSAMRKFAARLESRGVTVRHVRLDDPDNTGSILGEVGRALADQPFDAVVRTACGKWELEQALLDHAARSNTPWETREDDRFLCSRRQFERWAQDRRELRMEFFYREMRQRYGLLMDRGKPKGGRWNFDRENRKRPPPGLEPPARVLIAPDAVTAEAMADVERHFGEHWGTLEGFGYATTPEEAERVFAEFLARSLPVFGDYQDFMRAGEPWMWHGLISAAMNIGLLDPLDCCRRAEAEYRAGRAPLNCVEGFIRQILGWREFIRGVYWLKMPEYKARNALEADRDLPWFYWSGETRMACVKDVVEMTRAHAYAHHIQRLMVTGQFAMLLGVRPADINDWYMVVFADSYEWVELPNTHGMATFADGGIVGSKPYAASGAYINRMSDYCGGCSYDVKDATGANACPFNSLYWDFLKRNEGRLRAAGRLQMPYRTLDRMDAARVAALQARATAYREEFCGPLE